MLKVFRRHQPPCKRPAYDPGYTKCKCPIRIRGTLNQQRIDLSTAKYLRAPLDRDMTAATELARSWEKTGDIQPLELAQSEVVQFGAAAEGADKPTTVEEAVDAYLDSAKKRGGVEGTLTKKESWYRRTAKINPKDKTGDPVASTSSSLLSFCESQGIRFLHELTLPLAEKFRTSWKVGDLVRHKRQSSLIGFFHFCERRGWYPRNYAFDITEGLGKIQVKKTQTGYFKPEQYKVVLDATYAYSDRPSVLRHIAPQMVDGGKRIRTLLELMRWTGLRIRDAVTLKKRCLSYDSVKGRWRVIVYQKKTGDDVFCPIPPHVAELLNTIPASQKGNTNETYFFWTGIGKEKTIVSNWERSFKKLFTLANLQEDGQAKRCYPHMLRDTFAVEALVNGMPVQQVSEILGHESIDTTERHYLGWVRARQGVLDDAAEASWAAQGIGVPPKPGPGRPRKVISIQEATTPAYGRENQA
jgi:integrase/recombinase XerD